MISSPLLLDTGAQARLLASAILTGAAIIPAVMFILLQQDMAAEPMFYLVFAAIIPFIIITDVVMATLLYRFMRPARVSINRHLVTVEPSQFLWMKSRALAGTFPLSTYRGLEIGFTKHGRRLSLIGHNPAHTLPLMAGPQTKIEAQGKALAAELSLPLNDATTGTDQ